MTVTDNVFPQSGDADFAENFASWVGRGNVTDFVETGMGFTVDYTNEVLDISQGKAFVVVDNKTISSNSETRLVLDYAVTISARTGIALNTDETNNLIYLDAQIGTNDSPTIHVETTTGAAEDDWLLLGVIDTVNDTVELRNREPSADFETLSTLDTFSAPVYSDPANASASESSIIYVDGAGSTNEGIYVYNGTSYISAGVREIDRLDDVTGVTSLTLDSDANQPAAGTAGRIYIDESNDRIERDSGSGWVTIGTNPANIGAGDLGFDPATQIELDDHASLSSVHHTRPTAGTGLSDSNNTFNFNPSEVSGVGIEADGSGNIRVDEDYDFTFTTPIDFSAGLDVQGDVTDGAQVIWDVSAQEVPDSAMGSIDNATLTNDSVTINAGTNLTGGGTVTLGGSITLDAESSTDTTTGISDNGTQILAQTDDINFTDSGASTVNVTDDTDGTVTVNVDSTDSNTTYSAGNALSLSGTQFNVNEGGISHDNISGVSAGDHHTRYSDEEAQDAVGGILATNQFDYDDANDGILIQTGGIGSSEIESGSVTDSELDLSITPVWTGSHTFNTTVDLDGTGSGSGLNFNNDYYLAYDWNASGNLVFADNVGSAIADLDQSGNFRLTGSLTENASL